MVDPITIIGAAGAIANIIDIASKTIQGLHELHSRWSNADLTLLSLISQLISLQAALTKIEEWLTLDEREHHHQFVLGLNSSLLCCKTLVCDMSTVIEGLEWRADGRLATSSRIEVVFGERKRNDYHKAIDAQISVLTLLLSACSCTTLTEQQKLLRKSRNRKAISNMEQKTASASLRVMTHDCESTQTRRSDTMSKLSKSFTFDRELLGTKVYEKGYRKSLRLWRSKTSTTPRISAAYTPQQKDDVHLVEDFKPTHAGYVDSSCQTDDTFTTLQTDCNKKTVRTRVSHTSLSGDTIYLDADIQEDLQWRHAPVCSMKEQQTHLLGVIEAAVQV